MKSQFKSHAREQYVGFIRTKAVMNWLQLKSYLFQNCQNFAKAYQINANSNPYLDRIRRVVLTDSTCMKLFVFAVRIDQIKLGGWIAERIRFI